MSDNDPPDIDEFGATPEVPERRAERIDRRKSVGDAPGGRERRWADRRKRANEGRERYIDMVQRERAVLFDQGVARSTEQLLDLAGAGSALSAKAEEQGIRDRATGDQLRSILPVQSWLPLSIH